MPHAIVVTTAEAIDRRGRLRALDRSKQYLDRGQSSLTDGGYTRQPFADGVKSCSLAAV